MEEVVLCPNFADMKRNILILPFLLTGCMAVEAQNYDGAMTATDTAVAAKTAAKPAVRSHLSWLSCR